MKKFALGVLLILSTISAKSQLSIGVKGGYSMSDISFYPSEDTRLLFGYGLDYGLVLKYYDLKYLGFQAELYSINRGYRQAADLAELGDTLYMRVNNYIELPIFIQARLNLKLVYIHVNAGPYIAYMLNAKEGNNSSGDFKLKKIDFNVLRDKRLDYGIMAGVGLSRNFKWGTIQAEMRIARGYGDFLDPDYPDNPKQSKAIVESVNVAYLYTFGK
ncbi:MAG: PorT family protein [Bacteroidales bacterium]|nr:PorT family protein [Bacteroidales bacterium]HPD95101.1 porin family protein [Tenuifilaceae bacterium]HRX31539.1 porin family protein [Tenuifilaceae bacterium]